SPDLVVTNVVEFVRSFFTYLIIINTLTSLKRVNVALYAIMSAGVFLATLTIFQTITGTFNNDFGGLAQYRVSDIAGDSEAARPGGTIGDANYYGQLLLVVVPIAMYLLFDSKTRLMRLIGLACTGILTVAVIFTYSRGDAVALGAIVVATVIFRRPNPLIIVGGLVALVLSIPLLPANYMARLTTVLDVAQGNQQTIYGEDSIRGRAGATQAAIEMFADHPFFGVGRENYPLYQLEYLNGTGFAKVAKGIPPHNLYLEVAAEHGLMGLIVFGGLLVAAWLALMDARKRFRMVKANTEYQLAGWLAIMFIGYLVTAASLHGAFLYILWMIIALIAAVRIIARQYTPVLSALPIRIEMAQHLWASTGRAPEEPARRLRPALRRNRAPELPRIIAAENPIVASNQVETNQNQSARKVPQSPPLRSARSTYVRKVKTMNASTIAQLETWLAAGEAALRRGDLSVARAMVELALERDPYNAMAWDMDVRIRLDSKASQASEGYVLWNAQQNPSHTVNDKMYDFWHGGGGVPVFGYPISARFYEISASGEMIEVQYFERARLEYRSRQAGTEMEVQSGNLGLEAPISGTPVRVLPNGLAGEQLVVTPQHTMPRRFFDFWVANGGPNIMGFPITGVLLTAGEDDRPVYVQYFEKARLEYHTHLAETVYAVQISRLGTHVFKNKYSKVAH
ncbi:MAG: O-antigen ligase family protein, partial [Chloroflexia bacterium]